MRMKRSSNWSLWIGFLFVLGGLLSYSFFFARFPVTRDFPWANLLLFAAGGILLVVRLVRAFGKPNVYRGKIFGSTFAVLSALMIGLFSYVMFYGLRQVPASTGAPRVGQKVPEFTLPDQNDKRVTLADLVSNSRATLLIFYRGFW
jgi:drug/metabolite transporter (DMT)-like permease